VAQPRKQDSIESVVPSMKSEPWLPLFENAGGEPEKKKKAVNTFGSAKEKKERALGGMIIALRGKGRRRPLPILLTGPEGRVKGSGGKLLLANFKRGRDKKPRRHHKKKEDCYLHQGNDKGRDISCCFS